MDTTNMIHKNRLSYCIFFLHTKLTLISFGPFQFTDYKGLRALYILDYQYFKFKVVYFDVN
jgi:hypothetical protein